MFPPVLSNAASWTEVHCTNSGFCLAVSLSVPWEHLMVVMRAALCVLSLLSVLALSPEISQDKRFRDTQEQALEHSSPGVPWLCGTSNSTSSLQHCSLVVAKPGDSHLSHMHSITCCCSVYFLASFLPPKSTMVLCPQVLKSGIPNKAVR